MAAPIAIRPAIAAERVALEALQRRASLANPGDRAALLAHPDAIDLPAEQIAAGQVFVAEQNGAALGFAVILPRADGDTELDALFVEPSAWRRGVGRRLVELCAKRAEDGGAAVLHVIGNPHAQQFYEACGFASTGSIETRFGRGLLYRRSL